MSTWLFWQAAAFVAGVVYCSFFEWTLHRFLMHKNWSFFSYPFRTHAVIHHTMFKADDTYHLKEKEKAELVPMAWWNAPLIWLLHVPLLLGVQWAVGKPVFWGILLSMMLYYAAYEYMHWCMHIPKNRHVERSPLFVRLNGHHLLHHRYMHKNFNVVLPLADLVLGTLVLRSPIHFAQATGRSIPNLQPKLKKAA